MAEQVNKIKEYAIGILGLHGSHGFDHTERVSRLCKVIGSREEAMMDIVLPAALLHDIGRPIEREHGIPHEIAGAEMAEAYLQSIRYPEDLISPIIHAILTHRYQSTSVPGTLEAKVLSDADKLDAMGAIGIARTFVNAGEENRDISDAIDHINKKLLQLRNRMYTRTAMQIAEKRHDVLISFLEAYHAEILSSDP